MNSNRYLIKIAAKSDKSSQELRPHTQAALEKLDKTKGIIAHHSLGSGKTLLFLKAIERMHKEDPSKKALILAPASLTTNIDKEIQKHKVKVKRDNVEVYSYEKATNLADELALNRYGLVVADEAHKLRNPKAKRVSNLREVFENADKRLLTTATANYNHLADMSSLVNLAAGKKILPEDRPTIEREFTKEIEQPRTLAQRISGAKPAVEVGMKNQNKFIEQVKDHVHFYDSEDDPNEARHFPTLRPKNVDVEMDDDQRKYYRFVEGQMPFLLRMKIRNNLPLDKKEQASLNSFSTGVRQVSNSHAHLVEDGNAPVSPKIRTAINNLKESMSKDKNFKGLVYSNFLDAGLHQYSKELGAHKIRHAIYDGSLSRAEKDKLTEDYNKGKIPVLLISSSGSEGLNTFGTKKVQVIEPHFNKAKIDQVIGRSRRYKSHDHLPEEERFVDVEHYRSVFPKSTMGFKATSIDEYLSNNSDSKNRVFNEVKDLLKKHAA